MSVLAVGVVVLALAVTYALYSGGQDVEAEMRKSVFKMRQTIESARTVDRLLLGFYRNAFTILLFTILIGGFLIAFALVQSN